MENFNIQYNVPTVQPPITERAVAHVEAITSRLVTKLGHGAVLAYAGVFDAMYETDYRTELREQFAA